MQIIKNAYRTQLSGLLNKTVFHIPKYQRAYSWDESNWKELWDDINNNILTKDSEHFLGSIIFYQYESHASKYNHVYIIDGQQRITTITILFRVIYEKLKESGLEYHSRMADELYEKYIGSVDDENFYLVLSKKDERFFSDYIQKHQPIRKYGGKLISNKSIRKCYEYFKSELENNVKDNIGDYCYDLKKKLESSLIFAVIDCNSDVDAYTIFESINSKREGLTISDLLKNYFFSAADQFEKARPESNKLSLAEESWEKIEQSLDKIEINQFIRHFWISNFGISDGRVYEKELYRTIKAKFHNDTKVILEFLTKLTEEVDSYASIVNASLEFLPKEGNRALRQLQQLRNRQFYPLILSAVSSGLKPDEISKLVRQISSVAVRRALMGKNPNELETFFMQNAAKLRMSEINIIEIISKLSSKEFWIDDKDIIDEISRSDFEDQEIFAKFILQEFEKSETPGDEKTVTKVTLEHILPRNPENFEDWRLSKDEHYELLWNIGNLALIGQKYNSKMSNNNFKLKKQLLSESEIKTTRSIAKAGNWTKETIQSRNKDLGQFITKWWPKIE